MVATSSQASIASTNRYHPARGGKRHNINSNGKDFMLQILIVAHIVVFEFAKLIVFTEEKDKKMRQFTEVCEGALLICFVASMFTCVNF